MRPTVGKRDGRGMGFAIIDYSDWLISVVAEIFGVSRERAHQAHKRWRTPLSGMIVPPRNAGPDGKLS